MADQVTNFAALQLDAASYWITMQQYRLAERQLVLGKFATNFKLPERMGKVLRVTRHKRIALPNKPLTEGIPPDAVALAVENVDVTVEQWGIVALLTDVAIITPTHPALAIANERVSMAMAEMFEREIAETLMSGTVVFFPAAVSSRGGLAATDELDTAVILKTTTSLRAKGAATYEGGLYGGVMAPQQEADVLSADATFKDSSNFAGLRKLEFGEIGVWMGTRWGRGNFLPIFKGVAAPDGAAATAEKGIVALVSTGGPFANTDVVKVRIVARDIQSDYERKISQEGSVTITATDEHVDVTAPTSANYVYDIYVSEADNSSVLRLQFSRVAASSVNRLTGYQTTGDIHPAAPASTVEVFTAFVFGKDAYGRVELNGMSLQSYITPAGPSWSNPLAQGRKVGAKVMWKSFILENPYFARIETGSAFAAELPA